MKKINKRKGFTLIELLVVIAIIALLLSILIPALSKVKEQAKFILCQSNLRSYGLVGTMYTTDNGGSLPDPWRSLYTQFYFPSEGNRGCRWHNPDFDLTQYPEFGTGFWPYLEVKDINLCPAFKSMAYAIGERHDLTGHVASIPIEPQFGYSMNGFLGAFNPESETLRRDYVEKISKIARPATVFMFAEENMQINQDGEPWSQTVLNDNALISQWTNVNITIGTPPRPAPFLDSFATFHKAKDASLNDGVSNAVFADGHVEQVDVRDTHELAWPK